MLIVGVVGGFILFSDKAVYVFSGKLIPQTIAILPYLAIAFGFVALANVILLYKLSLGRTNGYYWLIIYNFIEIILFFVVPRTVISFTFVFVLSSVMLFIGSIFVMNQEKPKQKSP